MNLTQQQSEIVDYVTTTPNPPIILVSSIAGSGKTTLLRAIADSIPHTNGMYLAYNKSIATESKSKFPSTTNCLTTHALAYRAVVVPNKYKIGFFNYKSIKEKISYEHKCALIDDIKEFCLSKYISFVEFGEATHIPTSKIAIANKYLELMEQGKIDCTHEFYLKLFHILLASGKLTYDPFDFVMIDEAGDLNEVTLEIFKLLPSNLKLAVGDPYQNIYTFNHTINCFEALREQGKLFNMTTSFRVNKDIASQIQNFCNNFINPEISFEGIDKDTNIVTRGFISRTNSSLIAKMIELNEQGIPYGLVRKASEIFKLPLMLASIKYQGFITDPNYKFIQSQFNDWYEDPKLKEDFKSPLSYIASLNEDDYQLTQAIRLLLKYSKSVIFDTYREASFHESKNHNLILTTAHSSKGLEFDEVVLDYSMNDFLGKEIESVQTGFTTTEDRSYKDAVNLYYVACSRAKKSLINAYHLNNTTKLV